MELQNILLGLVTIGGVIAAGIWVLKTLFDAEMPSVERLIWLLIILMFPLVGALIWQSWGRDSLRQRLDAGPGNAAAFRKEEAPD
ncbi:PLDc N-terminal domain-containing protein [Microterricola viridarii]|uniref:Phospholipase_D-nuclease N-terminal n=1 Tax=Microterricola viridarii TaxID=412690 RepID=A0A1H1RIG5_9MICO|nr:PLDc N-terminal domain-containing protein [Microterricola viridarii]SDS35443.1 Phospholipase_D-nuclease N-terminal [Microterricola viridarii]